MILFGTFTSKNAVLICLGEISFLGYKVGKLTVFSGLCLNCILYKYLDPIYTGLVTTVQVLYLLEICCLG